MKLFVETFVLSQNLDTHTKLLFCTLSVEVFSVLGMDVTFMGNNLECLENVNVGKKGRISITYLRTGVLFGPRTEAALLFSPCMAFPIPWPADVNS